MRFLQPHYLYLLLLLAVLFPLWLYRVTRVRRARLHVARRLLNRRREPAFVEEYFGL